MTHRRLSILAWSLAALGAPACHVFSDERLCSSDVNCDDGRVCVAGACAAPLRAEPHDGDDVGEIGAGEIGAGEIGEGEIGEGEIGEGEGEGEASAPVDAGGGHGVDDEEPLPAAGAADPIVLDAALTVKLVWSDPFDLDLHVIRQDEASGRFCRETRELKPRDRTVAIAVGDVAVDCADAPPRLDCTYRSCDELGGAGYDVDWLGDGATAAHAVGAEPILVALDGLSGDQRDGLPGEQVSVATVPRGTYLIAAAHPSPGGHDDGPACARLSIERDGVERFCRAIRVGDDEWQEVALLDVDVDRFDASSPIAAGDCTCP